VNKSSKKNLTKNKQAALFMKRREELSINSSRPVKDTSYFFGRFALRKPLPKGVSLDNFREYMETHYFDEK
jgi:hypothetical protein